MIEFFKQIQELNDGMQAFLGIMTFIIIVSAINTTNNYIKRK